MNRPCRQLGLSVLLLLLAACRSQTPADAADGSSPPASTQSFEQRLDALLAEAEQEEAYGETASCLARWQYDSIQVINEDVLLFFKTGRYWLNRLKFTCAGLERNMAINTMTRGADTLCGGDSVYANRPVDLREGVTASGRPLVVRATCTLGDFQSVPVSYGQALKELKP